MFNSELELCDEEMLFDETNQFFLMYLQCAFNVFNFENLLNDKKDEEIEQFVDLTIRV